MTKIIEPAAALNMTAEEQARMVARAQAGLADIAAGRTMSVGDALARIEASPAHNPKAD